MLSLSWDGNTAMFNHVHSSAFLGLNKLEQVGLFLAWCGYRTMTGSAGVNAELQGQSESVRCPHQPLSVYVLESFFTVVTKAV